MFKGSREPDFALGLMLGALAVSLVVSVILAFPMDTAVSSFSNCEADANSCEAKQDDKPKWWIWGSGLVKLEDSLAQWLMMLLSGAAAWYLYRTLGATREISQVQNMAYIAPNEVFLGNSFGVIQVFVKIENCGATPAKWFEIKGHCISKTRDRVACPWPVPEIEFVGRWNGLQSKTTTTAPLSAPKEKTAIGAFLSGDGFDGIFVEGVIKYCTIFDEIFETEFKFFAERPLNLDPANDPDFLKSIVFARENSDVRTYEKVDS